MNTIVVRGGGDLATGCVQKLLRSGFKVIILETERPTAIRRAVSLCEAVYEGEVLVEDIRCVRVRDVREARDVLDKKTAALLIDPAGTMIEEIKPMAVLDAIMAKKNIGTHKNMAPITIALGPGFCASEDVDVVIETMRGHDLGRLIFRGPAKKNTGIPGDISGVSAERVIYATETGIIKNLKNIGAVVKKGETLAQIENKETNISVSIAATIDGILRGIIKDGSPVKKRLKIADIDPRSSETGNCSTISDKGRALGGAVLEALLYLKEQKNIC